MSQEDLIAGLKFVGKHNLTLRESEVLVPLLKKPYTAEQLAADLDKNVTTVYHLIQRLKLKSLIFLHEKDENQRNVYQFNESSME